MITTPAAPDFSGPASADAYLAHHPGPVLVKGEPYSPPQPTTLPRETVTRLRREADAAIRRAARHEITLTRADFEVVDGEIYLDGMAPSEWIDAMIAD